MAEHRIKKGVVLRGIGVSPGVAAGPVALMLPESVNVFERPIAPSAIIAEIARFEEALIETRQQIQDIQRALSGKTRTHDASIFDAHLMVLDDRTFIEEIVSSVKDKQKNIEFAVQEGTEQYASVLEALEDDYLRERVADVRDVGRRILRNLTGHAVSQAPVSDEQHLIVAHDLAPSETAMLKKDTILGFATDLGSPTSHTAVMARALALPAVVGLHNISTRIAKGDQLLIDGNRGVLIINPDEDQLRTYGQLAETRRTIEAVLSDLQYEPAVTKDDRVITLSANVESEDELDAVKEYGAHGIGLLRSEFLHLAQNRMIGEEDQYKIYHHMAEVLAPDPLIIRTLDIGGDKFFFEIKTPHEVNPFLGLRSIRLCLRYPDYFRQQLRAVLRASVLGNVRLMYPMVSGIEELEAADEHLAEVKAELDAEGIPYNPAIERGVMIEVPAAALSATALAPHVDFFSIGTNDLIQYTVAVDRGNERVAYLYEPTHPGVLRLIQMTVEAAQMAGIWVGVCGEMAADPVMTPLLVGLGVEELSVTPRAVPIIKDVVRALSYADAQKLAVDALGMASAKTILKRSQETLEKVAPEIMALI